MTPDEALMLVRQVQETGSELEDVEVKTAAGGLPSVVESLSALGNRRGGGVIVFGLDENVNFASCDVYDVAQLQEDLASQATDNLQPPVRLSFTQVEVDGHTIVCAEVPECPDRRKPCHIRDRGPLNGAYHRVGITNRRMTAEEIGTLLGSLRDDFELEPVSRATFAELDPAAVQQYREEIAQRSPDSPALAADDVALLMRAGALVQEGSELRPTLAGVMVFGRDPQAHFPRFVVTVTQFEGTSIGASAGTGRRYRFDREITGRLPDMATQAAETILSRLERYPIIEGMIRRDMPEYPETVIREALVNAIAHRSYAYGGTAVSVRIFADRIEIRNPGILFGSVTLDSIEREQSTRNPRIIAALREHGLMEQRGTGVTMMIGEMRQAGLSPPAFEEDGHSFVVMLRNSHLMSAEMLQWLAQFGSIALNDAQRFALAYVRLNERIANRDYQRINATDGPTATRDLRGLVDAGLLVMHGTRGGAYYRLADRYVSAPARQLELEVGLTNDQRILSIVARIGPAARGAIAEEFHGRSDLAEVELRRVGRRLQRLLSAGQLGSRGDRRGRVYLLPPD